MWPRIWATTMREQDKKGEDDKWDEKNKTIYIPYPNFVSCFLCCATSVNVVLCVSLKWFSLVLHYMYSIMPGRSEMWLWVLLDKYRAGLQLLLSQVCEMRFVTYYEEQKKWWENVIFIIHVLPRLTALLTWAASLGWTSAVPCCNIFREYHAPVVFTLSYAHRFFIWNVTISNSRIIWMAFFAHFFFYSNR